MWRWKRQPNTKILQYSCLENPMDRGTWQGPWGLKESDMTECAWDVPVSAGSHHCRSSDLSRNVSPTCKCWLWAALGEHTRLLNVQFPGLTHTILLMAHQPPQQHHSWLHLLLCWPETSLSSSDTPLPISREPTNSSFIRHSPPQQPTAGLKLRSLSLHPTPMLKDHPDADSTPTLLVSNPPVPLLPWPLNCPLQ